MKGTSPDGKVTTGHLKSIVEVARELMDTGAIGDGTGAKVPWADLSPERKAALLRVNANEETFVRNQRQRDDIRRALTSSESFEWWTPSPYVEAARQVLGAIDLDPASCARANETVKAAGFFDIDADGVTQDWPGRVFMNPPSSGAVRGGQLRGAGRDVGRGGAVRHRRPRGHGRAGSAGKFEAADRGTLFLDEVADLSPSAQAKLLRAVQELAVERVGGEALRRVDIRMVVATNQNLRGLVRAGRFRADLYYRLAGVELEVPSLRCHREDILELAEYFLARHRGLRRLVLSESAAEALLTYDWPGNVRELQRAIERALALSTGDVLGVTDLPPELTGDYTEVLYPSVARAESMGASGSRYARLVLERCDRNKRRTCEVLGISYHTLQSYLRYRAPAPRPGC